MMRKNRKILTLAVAAAVMMAVTACGSKDKTETTASTEAVTEAETTTEAAETTAAEGSSAAGADQAAAGDAVSDEDADAEGEDLDAEDTEAETERNTVSEAGTIGADGTFKAVNGRFEIKVPAGWSVDEGSDDEYVTFLSESGEDMLEIINVSGSSADSIREVYPDTAEEYIKMVSRDDGMEVLSYNVDTKDDGSQTFQYSMKYANPSDGIHFLAESGAYEASKEAYICVTGTVTSSDDAVRKQVEEAVKSFTIK